MSTNQPESDYEVSRTTVFAWSSPERAAQAEPHLERAAGVIGRRLQRFAPDRSPVVEVVRVEGAPQLTIRMTMPRKLSEQGAKVRFNYYVGRAMAAQIMSAVGPMRVSRKAQFQPPWGDTVVTNAQQ